MYSYIINDFSSANHFNKMTALNEVRANLLNGTQTSNNSHVYRIKDLTDAINTSALIDVGKKQTYNEWLTNEEPQFDASDEFLDICKEVGECDIY